MRSAGVSLACTLSTILSSIGRSLVNRVSGVAWPSTFITIATSPFIESIRFFAAFFAASRRVILPASSPSIAFIDAEASSRMTTLRARVLLVSNVGSSAANNTVPRIARMNSSDMNRFSCFHSAFASFCSRTRFHRLENGTSKRRRRILMM